MKLTINTSFQENASSQYLLILVDSEQLQQSAATYQINKFEEITTATQYKAGLNETLALVGNVPASALTRVWLAWARLLNYSRVNWRKLRRPS